MKRSFDGVHSAEEGPMTRVHPLDETSDRLDYESMMIPVFDGLVDRLEPLAGRPEMNQGPIWYSSSKTTTFSDGDQ